MADAAGLQAARDQLFFPSSRKRRRSARNSSKTGCVTRLIKEGKVKKNQDTIKRLVTQYQG